MRRQTKSLSSKFLRGLNFFLLIVFAFLCVYPLYFIFINSISGADAVVRGVYILPEDFSLEFYKSLLQMPNIPNSIVVSVARTVLGTALTVICSSFLGYMVTQSELPMRKWVYRFVVATMYFNAGLIPWYILMVNLGLKNNFLLYILPSAVGAYYVVLSKTYIESIPASVEESAKIDGAGVLTIYARLILPMSMPIIACLIVFCAVNQWNAWSDNFYLVSDPKLSTLQYQLYMNLANESSNVTNTTSSSSLLRSKATTELGLRYALSMLTVLPIILVYPFMQKYFVKGIMLGAVKG
ncbi:MAG TPA: carbohydrate ABC transporter permease [Candidatus Spyradocola merdavium]|nr:carbohydrate ABC transporter permease [Candidatus Spyradocola merdavium]